jgi:hypothetical protein
VDVDDFDLVLLEGISRGFFDEKALLERGAELDAKFKAEQTNGSFEDAWRLFHDSFEDNEAEVIARIFAAFTDNIQHISPMNLNGTVRLLKNLGAPERATEAVKLYIRGRSGEDRSFFDLVNDPFGNEVDDPEVRAAFDDKFASFVDERSPQDVLVPIAKNSSWSRDDIALLGRLSADDFYRVFRDTPATDLSRVIRASLSFGQLVNADAELRAISARAREALIRIGNESRINRLRVRKYGIEVEPEREQA